MSKNIYKFGPYLIIVAALLWGLDGILRRSLFDLPPISIVFYEHLIGLIIILPIFLLSKNKDKFTRREWGALLLVSLLSGVLATLWFTTALTKVNYISFSVVFLIQKLQPIFATALAVVLLREKINRNYLLWGIVALVSAYFVTFPGGIINAEQGQETIVAALFALAAAFAWGSSTVFSRYLLMRHSNTSITAWRFIFTTLFAFILLWPLAGFSGLSNITTNQIIRLIVIALSTGLVALWIYYKGLKYTQVKVSTILELFFPLVAVVIDIFLFDNILAPSQYFAAAILMLAMYMVSMQNVRFDKKYSATIKSGAGRGKRIGFPTLNFVVPDSFEHAYGIYCGWVIVGDEKYKAAFHYGPIPTFEEKKASLEAYLLDKHLDQVPDVVYFQFVARLRDVNSFSASDKLALAIKRDVDKAYSILK